MRVSLLVIAAMVPAIGLMLHAAEVQRDVLERQAEMGAFRLARLAAADQARLTEGAHQLLATLSELPQVRSGEPAECKALVRSLVARHPQYAAMGVARPDGFVYCSAAPPPPSGLISRAASFRGALATREFAVGDYVSSGVAEKPSLDFAFPIVEAGEVVGVVFAALDLAWLEELAARASLPSDGVINLVDRRGTILARHPDGARHKGKPAGHLALVQTILEREEGVTQAAGIDGIVRLFGFTPLPTPAGASRVYVAVGMPPGGGFVLARDVHHRSLVAIAVVFALALVAAWVGGQLFVMRPLESLTRTARRLRAGELEARTGLSHGPGELSQLALAFDEMASSLETRTKELLAVAASARALAGEHDLEIVARTVVERTRAALGARWAVLWIAGDGQLTRLAHTGIAPAAIAAVEVLSLDADHPLAKTAREQRPSVARDVLAMGARAADPAEQGEAFVVPLAFRGHIVGVLAVAPDPGRGTPEGDMRLAALHGDLFAAAVENARLYDEVRSALRVREEFLGAAAHELRTPATVLKGYAQLLGRHAPRDDAERHVVAERLERAAERTARLASELLEAYGLAREALLLRAEPLDVSELVADSVRRAESIAPAHRFSVRSSEKLEVSADREHLSLALRALLENAVKYQPGGGSIEVVVDRHDTEAVIEVRAPGPGVPPERLAHLFEPLYEPWPPGSPHYVGVTGLGLYLARRIVQAHGGSVEASAVEGGGNAVRFHLPLSKAGALAA